MRSIIVAFTDHPAAQKIRTILTYNGFNVAGVCTSGAQVLSMAGRLQDGGVILCSYRFNDMTTGFLAEQLSEEYDFLVLRHPGDAPFDRGSGIYSLQLPLQKSDLLDSLRMLLTTREIRGSTTSGPEKSSGEARREDRPERSSEERILIVKAKNVLMERNGLTEEQAHRFLQKRSMDNGSKLTDTARAVIEGW